jgi:hypothetical protein
MILFHPSSVGHLMGEPKSIDPAFLQDKELAALYRKKNKTDDDKAILAPYWERTLSEGAKSYLKQMAREHLFGYRRIVTKNELQKGIICEPDSIALYNTVHFTRYQKNTERRVNDWLTGECDIYAPGVETIDTKSVWSLDSFPLLPEDAHDPMYDWQGVAYMILWPDVQRHRVAFCAVDTPDDLIKWMSDDERAAHKVSHIDPAMRVTVITYQRDHEKEHRLMVKMGVAREYLLDLIERFKSERA